MDEVIKAYQTHIEKLADEYRANHVSHETHFPNGAELGRIIDKEVERLRNGGNGTVKPSEPKTNDSSAVSPAKGMGYGSIAAWGYGLF